MKYLFHSYLLILTGCILLSCSSGNQPAKDTPRRGKKIFYADEAYRPLMETASYTFMGLYPYSELDFVYTSETDAMNAMAKGKTRTIFVSRDFTEEEKKNLHASNIQVKSMIIAHDAVTFIVNTESTDTTFTLDQLRTMFTTNAPVGPNSGKATEFVFDKVQSSNFNTILRWLDGKPFGSMVHALNSTEEVIEYVKQHKNVIGIIGYNHIADLDDRKVVRLRETFKIASIQAQDKFYWKPDRATVTEKKYPFCKEIWAINSGAPDGLNSGFVNFLNSRQGQLLMEKCELGPGRGTPREINFITQ